VDLHAAARSAIALACKCVHFVSPESIPEHLGMCEGLVESRGWLELKRIFPRVHDMMSGARAFESSRAFVPHPVSWTREGGIEIAPPPSIVDPDATVRSCFIGHAAVIAARAATGV
jgi:hypothetical protein